ncbi:MAG: hypothetical protein KDB53_00435 [Planctomycetes bacterium]|nr:hypothetical protein [Planctomycetota bacterium]
MSHLRLIIVLAAALASQSCIAPPVAQDAMREPELREINRVFAQVVTEAHADPKITWVSGWEGNTRVNNCEDGSLKGLCWEWADLVYDRITPVARRVGWDTVKVTINNGWFSEHHAVAVFNPRVVHKNELLKHPDLPGWVLDAWRHGKAEVWTLNDWMRTPVIVFQPAAVLEP